MWQRWWAERFKRRMLPLGHRKTRTTISTSEPFSSTAVNQFTFLDTRTSRQQFNLFLQIVYMMAWKWIHEWTSNIRKRARPRWFLSLSWQAWLGLARELPGSASPLGKSKNTLNGGNFDIHQWRIRFLFIHLGKLRGERITNRRAFVPWRPLPWAFASFCWEWRA